jgi:hypothetical protein
MIARPPANAKKPIKSKLENIISFLEATYPYSSFSFVHLNLDAKRIVGFL